jgi:NADH:ubiquinone oxidoreductase subunit D
VPERAQIIRVLLMELSRIAAHLIYLGTTGIDLGAVTMFFLTFSERERIYEILDAYPGHRMNNTYVRVGGVYADVEERVSGGIRTWLDGFPAKVDEFEDMLTGNRIWYDRNHGVGILNREQVLAWSLTGPNLRGSGIDWDLRKKKPYSGYENYEFDVPVGTQGDCYDRYLVRIEEMRQSTRICRQALDLLAKTKGGEFLAQDPRYVLPPKDRVHNSMEELIHQFKVVTDMALPAGQAYHAVESSKGELGFFVASDGTSTPLRCHVRAPGLMNEAIPLLGEGRSLGSRRDHRQPRFRHGGGRSLMALPESLLRELDEIATHYPQKRAALIPALHRCQEELGGWISPQVMEDLASWFGIEPVEVYGVASFYPMFHLRPVGAGREHLPQHQLRLARRGRSSSVPALAPARARGAPPTAASTSKPSAPGRFARSHDGRRRRLPREPGGSGRRPHPRGLA